MRQFMKFLRNLETEDKLWGVGKRKSMLKNERKFLSAFVFQFRDPHVLKDHVLLSVRIQIQQAFFYHIILAFLIGWTVHRSMGNFHSAVQRFVVDLYFFLAPVLDHVTESNRIDIFIRHISKHFHQRICKTFVYSCKMDSVSLFGSRWKLQFCNYPHRFTFFQYRFQSRFFQYTVINELGRIRFLCPCVQWNIVIQFV